MILIVGAGIFGTTAALALRRRGHAVTLLDPGPLPEPAPLSASVDTSRAVRMEYGRDLFLVDLAAEALGLWEQEWSSRWGPGVFEPSGMLLASAAPFADGGFEADCFAVLGDRGQRLERIDRSELAQRFPQWRDARWVDGYFNPRAGVVDSGRVLRCLLMEAVAEGVVMHASTAVAEILANGGKAIGVRSESGEVFAGDAVLIAAGAWSASLLPELQPMLEPRAQTLVYLAPENPKLYAGACFPFWTWDIAGQGWYGFPATSDGLVKVGHHGPGLVRPLDQRDPDPSIEPALRGFLAKVLPDLAKAPLASQKVCFYCDSIDGDFWIGAVPERPGLYVATGGSGHGFKFAPLLGELIANAVLGVADPRLARFAWRIPKDGAREQARAGAAS